MTHIPCPCQKMSQKSKCFVVHRADVPNHLGCRLSASSFPSLQQEAKAVWGTPMATCLVYGSSKQAAAVVPLALCDNWDRCPDGAHIYISLAPLPIDTGWILATWALVCSDHVPLRRVAGVVTKILGAFGHQPPETPSFWKIRKAPFCCCAFSRKPCLLLGYEV